MMKQYTENIAESIESGEFFHEAMEWYAKKYISNFISWFYLLVISITLFCFAFLIFKTSTFDYTVKKYPFPIEFDDEAKYFPKIKSIANEKENINIAVARYLIALYVKQRESYDFAELEYNKMYQKLSLIKSLSSYRVFNEFFDHFNVKDNPDSPILKYKFNTEKSINIKSVTFPENIRLPDTAEVVYEAIEKSKKGQKVSTWKLSIGFVMTNINSKVMDKKSPFNFAIIKYNNKEYNEN